jgi:nucleoside-diphosphate-sugar epimerase
LRLDKVIEDDPLDRQLLSDLHKQLSEGKTIMCIAGNVFSPTFVDDVARALVLACEKDLGGLYHVANTEHFPREDFVRKVALSFGKKASIESVPLEKFNFSERRALKTYLDSSRFINKTGFHFTTIGEGLEAFKKRMR